MTVPGPTRVNCTLSIAVVIAFSGACYGPPPARGISFEGSEPHYLTPILGFPDDAKTAAGR